MESSTIPSNRPAGRPAAPTWLSPREMAARLRVHPLTLARLADAGRIPRIRVGSAVRYPAEQVEQALAR